MESRKAAPEEVRLQTTAKTGSEGADVMCGGRPFQLRAAATGKAPSPMVDNRVRRTTSDGDEADRRRRRASKSAGWHSSSKRYEGAVQKPELHPRLWLVRK